MRPSEGKEQTPKTPEGTGDRSSRGIISQKEAQELLDEMGGTEALVEGLLNASLGSGANEGREDVELGIATEPRRKQPLGTMSRQEGDVDPNDIE